MHKKIGLFSELFFKVEQGDSLLDESEVGWYDVWPMIEDLPDGDYALLVIDADDYWKLFSGITEAFPPKTRDKFTEEFYAMGKQYSAEFGVDWLAANLVVSRAALRAGMDHAHPAIRWLCFKVAAGMCEWLREIEQKGDSSEKETG